MTDGLSFSIVPHSSSPPGTARPSPSQPVSARLGLARHSLARPGSARFLIFALLNELFVETSARPTLRRSRDGSRKQRRHSYTGIHFSLAMRRSFCYDQIEELALISAFLCREQADTARKRAQRIRWYVFLWGRGLPGDFQSRFEIK